jgi:hypothetical protein
VAKRRTPRWYDGLVDESDDRDPVETIVGKVLETPQAQGLIDQLRGLLDRAGNAIDPRNAPPPPPPQAPPPKPRKRLDPLLGARAALLLSPTEPINKKLITERRRALAAVCHPDKGGSDEAMQRVNRATTLLLESLK